MAEKVSGPLGHVMDSNSLDLPFFGEVGERILEPLHITRFMIMETLAAIAVALVVIPLARHVARQRITRGVFFNTFEALLLFIRDEVARPAIDGEDEHGHGEDHGHVGNGHGRKSDQFLPFLWTAGRCFAAGLRRGWVQRWGPKCRSASQSWSLSSSD